MYISAAKRTLISAAASLKLSKYLLWSSLAFIISFNLHRTNYDSNFVPRTKDLINLTLIINIYQRYLVEKYEFNGLFVPHVDNFLKLPCRVTVLLPMILGDLDPYIVSYKIL